MSAITPALKMEEPVRLNDLDDDINLLDLLRSIGCVWKHWLIAIILVIMAFICVQAVQFLFSDDNTSYNKAIKFTFPGVEKSIYPNQSPFQIEDIIAPAVINEVYELANLAEFDFSIEKLRASLMIEPYAPTYPLIVQRFNRQLANSQLSIAEMQALELQMNSELTLATSSGALLTLTLGENELPKVIVAKILSEIPAVWAKRSINDKGVLDLNIHLTSSNSLNDKLIENVDYMVVGDLLGEKMGLVKNNIRKLLEFDGASTIRDPVTGSLLADLQQRVNDLQVYVIDELMSPIRSLGLTKNRQLSLYYYQDKKRTLTNELSLHREQASLVKQAFEDYYPNQQPATDFATSSDRGDFPVVASLPNADVLEKILALSSDSKTEEYRQSLSRDWLKLNMTVAELNNQIAGVDRTIVILNNEGDKSTITDSEKLFLSTLKREHLERTRVVLPKILEKMREYLDVTQRIYKQLSLKNVGTTGHLYRTITNNPFYEENQFDFKRKILTLILLLFITSVIVVPAFMIRNAMNK